MIPITELLMQGADAYTSLAEVAAVHEIETPEVTPTVSFVLGGAVSMTLTMRYSC
ncbi:LxmA leader domain family RiPP [Herbidospora mongoliensis]|uniref:LxmA leader domain family RiPP n=1 Tax=Herbidospora mongoliensis TaxID=688067 RepID=UPI000AF9E22D|nr:LxmA leader domain family RiPP [Herbidospora mongoliensis]